MPEGICPFADWRPVTPFAPGGPAKVGFCDHTAGGFYTTLQDQQFWNSAGYSVHFCISRRGEVTQLVNIFDRAWGQGRLGPSVTWPPYVAMDQVNPNEYLISTEHEDAVTENGQTVFVPRAAWTEAQYQSSLKVKQWCLYEAQRVQGANLLRFGINSLAGHYMFDSVNRANCPGPAWRGEYRDRLYEDLLQQKEGDMLVRLPMNIANPEYWGGKYFSAGQESGINVRQDFAEAGLPPTARDVELEIFLRAGSIDVFDGETSNGLAGYVSHHSAFRVNLDNAGLCWFRALSDGATIDFIRCLGYYQ